MNARKQTSPIFYLAALLIFLGGWIAAVIIAAGDFAQLERANVQPLDSAQLGTDPARIAVFIDGPSTDGPSSKDTIDCTSRAPGREPVDIRPVKAPIQTTSPGTTWHLLGITVELDNPADTVIACTAADGDDRQYGVAPAPEFRGAAIGNGIGILATAVSAILAIWTYRRRRRFAKGNR